MIFGFYHFINLRYICYSLESIEKQTVAQQHGLLSNYWDDDMYDNVKWTTYYNTNADRNVHQNMSPEACLAACEGKTCVSFFYHPIDRQCEILGFNLIISIKNRDPHIVSYQGNRLYRYLPPSDPGTCVIELYLVSHDSHLYF